jgi:hypothetical protein
MNAEMEDAMTDAIERLLAKQAITEMLYRYCRAYDRMDVELALSVWHPGGTVAYGDRYDGPVADYVGPSWDYRAKLSGFSHQVSNILIDVSGERAVSEAYVTATLQFAPEEGQVAEDVWRGRYLDRWSCRDGVWAIDHRQFVADSYARVTFPAERIDPGFLALSRTDRDDPSYALFASLR